MSGRPTIQIAIADDHILVRQGITQLIHSMEGGFNVFIEAADGRELLDKIAVASFQPFLCVLDISMPVMNGYETMAQLKKLYPHIRVLILTMLDDNNEFAILKMMELGARGYIAKNVHPRELEKALIDIFTEGYYFGTTVLKKFHNMNEQNMKGYIDKSLTGDDVLFLSFCCSSLTYEEIADKMGVSKRTAQNHAARLDQQLDVQGRVGLAMYAFRTGINNFTH